MSKRIKEIANYIPPYKNVADVGCDHGYLLDEAFKQGIIFAQAIDNKIGPLDIARSNLIKYRDKVIFSLSDGIKDLDSSIEVVVLAGMGGSLIIKILEDNFAKLSNVFRIIIQANRNIDKVRKFAIDNNFKIVHEKIIEEESIIYEIIVLEKGSQQLTNAEIMFGPILLKEKNAVFIKKWKTTLQHYQSLNRKENLGLIEMIIKNIFESN